MNSIAKNRFRVFFSNHKGIKVIALSAVVLTLLVGYAVLRTNAVSFFAGVDVSQGTPTGNAQLVNDSGASGGKAIKFGPEPSTPPPSPEPEPTPEPTPPPSGGGGDCAFPNFPNADCTGWQHTGVTLHTSGCPTTITTDNATYDSCRFTGALIVQASNVTIKRSRIEGRVVSTTPNGSLSNLTLTDVEIDGGGVWDFNQAAIGNSDYTCIRCHIHSTGRGANLEDNVLIQDSYLHGWVTQADDHETAIGSNGGSGNKIIHNNVVCDSNGCSAALSLYGDFSPVNDVLVEKNLFSTSSGGFCIYGGSVSGKPYPNATNVRFIDNRFSKKYNPQCGVYGAATSWKQNNGNVWSGNVWSDGSGSVNP